MGKTKAEIKKKIMITTNATGKKDCQVQAYIVGALGVHKSRKGDGDCWKVSHIESGCSVARCRDFNTAMALARELSTLDWSGIKSQRSKTRLAVIAPLHAEIMSRYRWAGVTM